MTTIKSLTDRIDSILASHDNDDCTCNATFSNDFRMILLDLNMPRTNDLRPMLDPTNLHEFAHLDQSHRRDLLELRDLLNSLISNEYARDELSHLLMQFSLCPIHAIDFAICFDDDDPDCAQLRLAFPYSHDT